MTIAKMVREMIARGVDPDVIELAVATAEEVLTERASADVHVTDRDVTAERRREKDRLRQQARRDNLRTSRDNPQTSADVTKVPLSKEEKKEEDKQEREATSSRRHASSRGCRLPDDWAPSPPDTAIADELLGSPDRRRAELEKFRDHWKQQPGSKGVKLDWNAAWRNWIRRAAEYRGGTNGHRPHNTNGRPAGNSFFDGLRSLAEDIARDGEAPGPAGPEIPRGRIEIDG